MYDGYIWRLERDQQHTLALAFLNLQAQGAQAELEDLMGRPPYPVLRSLQTVPTVIKRGMDRIVQTPEDVRRDLEDLKEVFKDEIERLGDSGSVLINPASETELDLLLGESGIGGEKPVIKTPPKLGRDQIESDLAELKETFKEELEGKK